MWVFVGYCVSKLSLLRCHPDILYMSFMHLILFHSGNGLFTLDEHVDNGINGPFLFRGIMDALVKTYRNEGIKGFYKGLLPGFFGVSHTAIQLMMYEEMKSYYKERHNMSSDSRMVRYSHRF